MLCARQQNRVNSQSACKHALTAHSTHSCGTHLHTYLRRPPPHAPQLLRHDMSWFDAKAHSTGVLTTALEADAAAMALATGLAIGQKVRSIAWPIACAAAVRCRC
jgi:hypothetical protein